MIINKLFKHREKWNQNFTSARPLPPILPPPSLLPFVAAPSLCYQPWVPTLASTLPFAVAPCLNPPSALLPPPLPFGLALPSATNPMCHPLQGTIRADE